MLVRRGGRSFIELSTFLRRLNGIIRFKWPRSDCIHERGGKLIGHQKSIHRVGENRDKKCQEKVGRARIGKVLYVYKKANGNRAQ